LRFSNEFIICSCVQSTWEDVGKLGGQTKESNYFPGMLRNGGLALKTQGKESNYFLGMLRNGGLALKKQGKESNYSPGMLRTED
jgi:hypothetical protein